MKSSLELSDACKQIGTGTIITITHPSKQYKYLNLALYIHVQPYIIGLLHSAKGKTLNKELGKSEKVWHMYKKNIHVHV